MFTFRMFLYLYIVSSHVAPNFIIVGPQAVPFLVHVLITRRFSYVRTYMQQKLLIFRVPSDLTWTGRPEHLMLTVHL